MRVTTSPNFPEVVATEVELPHASELVEKPVVRGRDVRSSDPAVGSSFCGVEDCNRDDARTADPDQDVGNERTPIAASSDADPDEAESDARRTNHSR